MRALLVFNPKATSTTKRGREVLARALSTELKLEVVETAYRGHAAALALRAARDGVDLVAALGGDGTINEVVNGLLTDGPQPGTPALAIVPGGSTNVFSRALGQSQNPIEATGDILATLRAANGARVGQPALTLERPGEEPVPGLFLAIVSNTTPWTYLHDRPIRPSPEASFDTGLDLFSLRRMRTLTAVRHASQMLRRRGRLRGRHLFRLHDLSRFSLHSDRPLGFQVDGDYLGEREQLSFTAVPNALRVVI